MKSKLYTPALVIVGAMVSAVHSGAAAQTQWPMNDAQHRSFFCGANALQSDQTMPAGYGSAIKRALDDTMKSRNTDLAGAVRQLQVHAQCDSLYAQRGEATGAGLVKTSGSPTK